MPALRIAEALMPGEMTSPVISQETVSSRISEVGNHCSLVVMKLPVEHRGARRSAEQAKNNVGSGLSDIRLSITVPRIVVIPNLPGRGR